jgi:hypothetical protein
MYKCVKAMMKETFKATAPPVVRLGILGGEFGAN